MFSLKDIEDDIKYIQNFINDNSENCEQKEYLENFLELIKKDENNEIVIKKKEILNKEEVEIFVALLDIISNHTYKDKNDNDKQKFNLFTQVPISAFLDNKDIDIDEKIYNKYYVDFLIVKKNLDDNKNTVGYEPFLIIEYQGIGGKHREYDENGYREYGDNGETARVRDQVKKAIFKKAGIKFIEILKWDKVDKDNINKKLTN